MAFVKRRKELKNKKKKGVRDMNNSYLPRMNNVGYQQIMVLQEKNEYWKLMSKQIEKKRL